MKHKKMKMIYLRLRQLKDLNTMKSCLKFAREEFMLIRKELEISKIVLALNPNQPNKELTYHLSTVLEKSSQNNLSSLFKTSKKYSKIQSVIDEFQKSLSSKNK